MPWQGLSKHSRCSSTGTLQHRPDRSVGSGGREGRALKSWRDLSGSRHAYAASAPAAAPLPLSSLLPLPSWRPRLLPPLHQPWHAPPGSGTWTPAQRRHHQKVSKDCKDLQQHTCSLPSSGESNFPLVTTHLGQNKCLTTPVHRQSSRLFSNTARMHAPAPPGMSSALQHGAPTHLDLARLDLEQHLF